MEPAISSAESLIKYWEQKTASQPTMYSLCTLCSLWQGFDCLFLNHILP
jgi:hypothetical protein